MIDFVRPCIHGLLISMTICCHPPPVFFLVEFIFKFFDMSEETSDCVKHPAFDGKDESWPFCKKKMESCLARLDLTQLLDETTQIPKDNEVGSADAKKAEFLKLNQKNMTQIG